MNPTYRGIPPFAMFTRFTPALPQFYTDVPTMEQSFKELCKNFHKMVCYVDDMAKVQNLTSEEVEQLQADFKKFQESGFEDYYEQQLEAWVNANVANIFNQYAKLVLFGLNDEGYFVAYVPESWTDIWFDTIATYDDPNYGCLVICWDGDGQNSDPQGPSSNRLSYEQLQYKPKINGVELSGNKSFTDLGLIPITTPISPSLYMTYRVQAGGSESIIVPDGEISAAPVLTVAEPVNMSTELTRIWEAIQSLGYTRNAAQLSRPVSLTDIGSIDEVQKDTAEIAEIDTTKEVQE